MRNLIENKACALALSAVMLSGCTAQHRDHSESFFGFDTFISITAEQLEETQAESIRQLLEGLDESFSSAYGADANTLDNADLTDCARKAAGFSEVYGDTVNLTIGAVTELWGISTDSPQVPDEASLASALLTMQDTSYNAGDLGAYPDGVKLDFGAAAKGYACDRVYDELEQTDIKHMVLSMGSSTLLYGEKSGGGKFKAAVKNPLDPSGYLGIISTDAAFISTSGGYERFFELDGVKYEHILSPKTGYPVETDLVSVTVIVPAGTENGGLISDMLSTAIYAEGSGELEKYLSAEDFYVIAADSRNNVYTSTGVDFTLYEESGFVTKT